MHSSSNDRETQGGKNRVLKHMPPKPNITKEEAKVLKELKQDKDRVILTVDKGMALIVVDRQEYISKTMGLLGGKDTYRPLTFEPTNKHKTNSLTY